MNPKHAIFIMFASCLLINIVGCTSTSESITSTPQNTSEHTLEDENGNVDINDDLTTLNPTKNPTSSPTQTPEVLLTIPPTANEIEAIETIDVVPITSTPTQVMVPEGNIYFRTPTGISRISLATEEVEELISIETDRDHLRVALSPDRQHLAYWSQAGNRSELWITELAQWSPELVLVVPDIEHEWVSLWWINERFILLEPGNFNPQDNLFIPTGSYLINLVQQNIEIETDSLIFGCSLATSPQSNEVATWCPAREGWTDPKLYTKTAPSYFVVFEGNGGYWVSDLAPSQALVEFSGSPHDFWSWSYSGEYATFSTYDEAANERTLYYIDAKSKSLITVEDDSRSYSALDWSPNQKYISFLGSCLEMSCNKIYDTVTQQVIWTSEGLQGAENGTFLNWSYDSKYIVVQSEGITIIDIETGESVRNFKDLGGGVIVWSP